CSPARPPQCPTPSPYLDALPISSAPRAADVLPARPVPLDADLAGGGPGGRGDRRVRLERRGAPGGHRQDVGDAVGDLAAVADDGDVDTPHVDVGAGSVAHLPPYRHVPP